MSQPPKVLTLLFELFAILILEVSVEMELIKKGAVSDSSTVFIDGCNSIVRLQPKIELEKFFNESSTALTRLHLEVSFQQQDTEKRCLRTTYDFPKLYEVCMSEKIILLLPSLLVSHQESYVNHVKYEISSKGGVDYVFDGGTAVRYPTKLLANDWFKKYTLTGWILPQFFEGRQYIISWSDGDTMRHDNMGFYTARHPSSNHLVFGFHHMHVLDGKTCMIKKKWKFVEKKVQWKFFMLTFQQCSVELFVNGSKLEALPNQAHYHLPEKHIQPKFVIGARWAGSMLKYDSYLHGKISGLVLTPNDVYNQKMSNCLLECNERLEYSRGSTRDLVETLNHNGNHLSVVGDVDKQDFMQTLNDVIYYNSDDMALNSQQKIMFQVKDLFTSRMQFDEINIQMVKKSSNISVTGSCNGVRDALLFFKQGVRLCTSLKINMQGCVQVIDSLQLVVTPRPSKNEKIYIASPYLRRHHLTLKPTETGFVVYGIASVSQYTEILYHIKYAYNGVLMEDIAKTISIVLSSKNGLIKSNKYILNLRASKNVVMLVADGYKESKEPKDTSPVSRNRAYEIIHAMSHNTFLPYNKKVASRTNKDGHHGGSTIWLVLACTFSIVVIVSMVGYGAIKWKSSSNLHPHQILEEDEEIISANQNTNTEYFWDEEGSPMTLTINPSERLSISNDPYAEILLNKDSYVDRGSTTEGSTYSDEEDTEFETDSIRQLEWDCLENSIETILLQDDEQGTESNVPSNGVIKTTVL